jgi:hypothetical protein
MVMPPTDLWPGSNGIELSLLTPRNGLCGWGEHRHWLCENDESLSNGPSYQVNLTHYVSRRWNVSAPDSPPMSEVERQSRREAADRSLMESFIQREPEPGRKLV